MFTGIVEAVGTVRSIEGTDQGKRLLIGTDLDGLAVGDSLSVNGVCLTIVARTPAGIQADVVHETLVRTDLGNLTPGDQVDLERPMRADGRFDGHIVQGHVDGIGIVSRLQPEGDSIRVRIDVPDELARYIAEKGSVAVDGVSLTVTLAGQGWFEVALIPHTLDVTVLGRRPVGGRVNIEVDVIAKYVERLMGGPR
ncbi:MAG: riboflavin synthase [Acidimicrobiia bacterium]